MARWEPNAGARPPRCRSWSGGCCSRILPACRCSSTWRRCARRWRGGKLRGRAGVQPMVPVNLVIDHSVQVDYYARGDALRLNMEMEFHRNGERCPFLEMGNAGVRRAADRSARLRHLPPGQPRVPREGGGLEKEGVLYPDTLVGTDSHTTMVNGLGGGSVGAWAGSRPRRRCSASRTICSCPTWSACTCTAGCAKG